MTPPIDYTAEISRKVLHVSSATSAVLYLFVTREWLIGLLVGAVLIALVVEVLRRLPGAFAGAYSGALGFMMRPSEWDRLTGATYALIGSLLSVILFPKPIAIAVIFILSVSDAAASLIGLRFGRARFLGKSLAGSLAFFLTSLLIVWAVLPDARGVGFVAAIIATVMEALPTLRIGPVELNDNLSIPLVTGAALWLMLEHLGAGGGIPLAVG